jgi:hypothetical protein
MQYLKKNENYIQNRALSDVINNIVPALTDYIVDMLTKHSKYNQHINIFTDIVPCADDQLFIYDKFSDFVSTKRLHGEERKEKARLEEERKWQEVNKSFADKSVSELHFDPSKYVTFELGCSGLLSVSVSDKRWEELAQQSASKSTIDFLRTLNSKGIVTNGFSEARYPDHQTVRDILALLENERFTLVLKVVENAKMPEDGINVFSPNLAEGVAVPRGARELRATDGSIIGMTLPITYGKMQSVYVMRNSTAARIRDDWAAFRAKVQREAKKSDNPVEHERTRLRGEIEDFMSSVRVQLASPSKRVIAKPEPKKIQKEKEKKPRVSPFKGMNTNRRSFN